MATRRIRVKLSQDGIESAIAQLQAYKQTLSEKCQLAVERLADLGIKTAKINCGEYGDVITFSKDVYGVDGGAKGRLIAVGEPVFRIRNKQLITMDPLLMAEFGSGWEAKVLDPIEGYGQGTFPGQTHAFDPHGWYYTDVETGEQHHSYGESPTFPMHSAMIAMLFEVERVFKGVFRSA